jgi:hypothetical protein
MSDWGKGVINNIGWGQGANNDIGWGSIYDKSYAGETLLKSDLNIDAFIMEVDTTRSGVSNTDQIEIGNAVGDYDVVAKQDGVIVATFNNLSDQETITLPSPGIYVLEIMPKATNGFNAIGYENDRDVNKILDIITYGTVEWTEISFYRCPYLKTIGDKIKNGEGLTEFFRSYHTSIIGATITVPEEIFWNCPNVTSFNQALRGNNIIVSPRIFEKCTLVDDFDRVFEDVDLTVDIYSKMIINLEAYMTKDNVSFDGGNSNYDPTISDSSMGSNLTTAQALTNLENRGWTFSDNGPI